jgi:hypothetical protein
MDDWLMSVIPDPDEAEAEAAIEAELGGDP